MTGSGAVVDPSPGRVAGTAARVVDAHAHVWDPTRGRYPWLGPHLGPLDRVHDGADLARAIAPAGAAGRVGAGPGAAGVSRAAGTLAAPDAVVLVQAADAPFDTEVMASAAAVVPAVAGLVVWTPLDRPEQVAAAIRRARTVAGAVPVVGVRTLQHDRVDPDWIVAPATLAGLAEVASLGLPYDFVTASPELLTRVPTVLAAVPGLRLVIDHLGKPPLGAATDATPMRRWRDLLHAAAASGDVVAKLSGLYPPGPDPAAWREAWVHEAVAVALEELGPDRLLLGSDWPMCEPAGGRGRVTGAVEAAVRSMLDGEDLARVLGGTAERVYGLANPAGGPPADPVPAPPVVPVPGDPR